MIPKMKYKVTRIPNSKNKSDEVWEFEDYKKAKDKALDIASMSESGKCVSVKRGSKTMMWAWKYRKVNV